MTLLEALNICQKAMVLNDTEFAEFLGIHNTALSQLKNKKRTFSQRHLAQIAQKLPQLIPAIDSFFQNELNYAKTNPRKNAATEVEK